MKKNENLKNMTLSEKLDHIWTYYKIPILIVAFFLFLTIYSIHYFTTQKESVLYSMVINASNEDPTYGEELYDGFLIQKGYDLKEYKVERNTAVRLSLTEESSSTDSQMLSVMYTLAASNAVDHVLANETILQMLSESGYIMPLSEYLSEEEIANFEKEGRILYAINPDTNQTTAFGVSLEGCNRVENTALFYETPCFGMFYAAPHKENSIDFLHYLMEE